MKDWIVLSHSYDNAGRRTEQKVTAGTVPGDQQIKYAYTDAGQLDTVTSYSTIDTTISSQIKYAYNGLGQLLSEYQQHGSAVNESTSPKVQYGYDSTLSGDRYSKGRRLTHRIWPNGRKIHSVYDGHNGIDDATGRVNKLAEDNGCIPGTTIVQYQFQGDGRAVRKEYDPYGKRTVLDASWSVLTSSAYDWNIGHQGLYWDRESGLYDNRARMYHPIVGRFVQRDPLGYVDGMGLYQYELGRPLTSTDAAGTCVYTTFDRADGCTLVFSVKVTLYGPHASEGLAALWQGAMEGYWRDDFTFKDSRTGGVCAIRFDFAVTANPRSNYWFTAGGDNSIYVEAGSGRSSVSGIGNTGTWYEDAPPETVAHETGHLMALADRYTDVQTPTGPVSVTHKGWEGNLMGDHGAVDGRNIADLLMIWYPPPAPPGYSANGRWTCPCKCSKSASPTTIVRSNAW